MIPSYCRLLLFLFMLMFRLAEHFIVCQYLPLLIGVVLFLVLFFPQSSGATYFLGHNVGDSKAMDERMQGYHPGHTAAV